MGLGLLLWAFLICFVQFNGSAGFPAPKGYIYEVQSFAEQPRGSPAEPILPNKPHAPEVNRLLNFEPIDWAPEEFNNFPLSPKHLSDQAAASQETSIQQRPTSFEVGPLPLSPRSADGSAPLSDAAAYYEPYPTYTSQDDSRQSEPVGSSSGVSDLDVGFPNTGSSADSGDWHNHRLVFEEVFHYPAENTGSSHLDYGFISNVAGDLSQADYKSNGFSAGYAFMLDDRSLPSFPVKEGDQPVYGLRMQSSFPSSVSGEENPNYQKPYDMISPWPLQKPDVDTKGESKENFRPVQSYIIQLRDGYQQGKYIQEESWRSPELPVPLSS